VNDAREKIQTLATNLLDTMRISYKYRGGSEQARGEMTTYLTSYPLSKMQLAYLISEQASTNYKNSYGILETLTASFNRRGNKYNDPQNVAKYIELGFRDPIAKCGSDLSNFDASRDDDAFEAQTRHLYTGLVNLCANAKIIFKERRNARLEGYSSIVAAIEGIILPELKEMMEGLGYSTEPFYPDKGTEYFLPIDDGKWKAFATAKPDPTYLTSTATSPPHGPEYPTR